MRILITGGAGYVGGRLVQRLTQSGCHEVCIATRNADIKLASWLTKAKVRHINWHKISDLTALCEGFDIVAHLAGVNAQDSAANSIIAYEFNVVATARLVEAAIQVGVRRMLYLSTAHVYGSPLQGDINESTNPFPLSPYAISHRGAEDIVRAAHSAGKLEGVVVRASNAFGAPVSVDVNCWMLLVNDLCRQAVLDHRLVLNSSGQQFRDFVPMQVMCAGLVHLLEAPSNVLGDGLFNLGGDWGVRVVDIAERIATLAETFLGRKLELSTHTNLITSVPTPVHYDITKLYSSGFSMDARSYVDSEILHLLEFCRLHHSDLKRKRA